MSINFRQLIRSARNLSRDLARCMTALLTSLAFLQILTMLATAAAIVSVVVLYRHRTDDYFVPFTEYLGSIRLAVPPILALFISYGLVFIAGIKLSDAPKFIIDYLRNRFFQSRRQMAAVSAALLAVTGAINAYTATHIPPSYEQMVRVLLGGEQDRFQLIRKQIAEVAKKDPALASRLEPVVSVFEHRSKQNFQSAEPNTTVPRILVRALEANVSDPEWGKHPLRKHALAEAYSMWAQASQASPFRDSADTQWKTLVERCLDLNDEVAQSTSPFATPLMRFSALHNSGNVLFYTGDYGAARRRYEIAMRANKNLSSGGNLIAAYVLLNQLDRATALGEELTEWSIAEGKALTEGSSMSSVLVNTAFAHLIKGEHEQAVNLMATAFDLENDDINTLNFAAALLLDGKRERSLKVLTHIKLPDLDVAVQKQRVTENYNTCYYLVKGLAQDGAADAPTVAAYFYTYMKRAREASQLAAETPESLGTLRKAVLAALLSDPTPCGDFRMIPEFKRKLES